MLQLDANIDEDMDLNKAEEPKDEFKNQKVCFSNYFPLIKLSLKEKEEEEEKK